MKRSKADPLEREIERAFLPGEFIGDRSCYSLVEGLEAVAARIAKLAADDPVRATSLYEVFLAGCHKKVNELDDSSGEFGTFAQGLICAWIKARQAASSSPAETASRLLAWMDDDPYAFCYEIEKRVAKAFDKAGLLAFERIVRTRLDSAKPTGDLVRDYPLRRFGAVLRAVYTQQGDTGAYVALTEKTGLTPRDCHTLATMLAARRKPENALHWVERGMALENESPRGWEAGSDLSILHRQLLVKLGRENEALGAAWAEYASHPNKYSYEDLMNFVPEKERSAWRQKALEAAASNGDLHSRIDLYLELKEMGRLAALARDTDLQALAGLSHFATEPAAAKLEKSHVDAAARLWRAQGMRIVDGKKSKYYEAAVSNFSSAKRCYLKAGLAAEWEAAVQAVRAAHFRKAGFMAAFEAVVSGASKQRQPSFLEQAKAAWSGRAKGGAS